MRKVLTVKITLFCLVISSLLNTAKAQNEVGEFIEAGKNDGAELAGAYLSPFFKGLGAGLNNNWYNTANVHKSGRFDLTITFSPVLIPASDKKFDVADLNLNLLKLKAGSPTESATLAGNNSDKTATFEYVIKGPGNTSDTLTINSPKGALVPLVPVPMAQLSIGVIKGTEIIGRFIPTTNLGNLGEIGLFGVGVKHDIKQWIPVMKELPFDLSVLAGYTQLKSSFNLNVEPNPNLPKDNPNTSYDNQKLNLKTSSTTINAIISKKLAVLTVYGGVGYMGSSTNISATGNYPIPAYDSDGNNGGGLETQTQVDPIDKKFSGANGANLTAGFRLKFLVLTIGGSYTLAKYQTPSVGLGICVDFL